MPCTCDNWDFDGCGFEPATPSHITSSPGSPSTEPHLLLPRNRIGLERHRIAHRKVSPASLMPTLSSDNGSQPAGLFSHTRTFCTESPSYTQESNSFSDSNHREEYIISNTTSNSGTIEPRTLDSSYCQEHEITSTLTEVGSTDKPLALTTHNSANAHQSSMNDYNDNDNNNVGDGLISQQESISSKQEMTYSQRDRSPISVNNLTADPPKVTISPETKRKEYNSSAKNFSDYPAFNNNNLHSCHHDFKRALIETNTKEFHHSFPIDTKRDFCANPHNFFSDNVSSQTASSSSPRLYSLLHSGNGYNNTSLDTGLDHFRNEPKYHLPHLSSSPSSPSSACLTVPGFPNSWKSSDVMLKSSPELRLYLSHQTPPHFTMDRNRIRAMSCSKAIHGSSNIFSLPSKGNGDITDHGSAAVSIKTENLDSKPSSSPMPDHKLTTTSCKEPCNMKQDITLATPTAHSPTGHNASRTTMTSLKVKKEDDSPLLEGQGQSHVADLPHRRLSQSSSPPASALYTQRSASSLSPWSDCSTEEFGYPSEDSLSNLGIPIKERTKCASDSSLYLPQLSPDLLSDTSTSMLVECRWKSCSQTFQSQKSLAQHVNNYHIRIERPGIDFQCHWQGCPRQGKGFNARYKMLIHIRTHTNEKPHKCAVCRKCFSRLENLKIHMRSHTGEKPYACTFPGCTKAYSNSSDRFKHVRTHQEEKPYKCKMPGCHKQYTDPSSLRKHVRTHNHCTKYSQNTIGQRSQSDNVGNQQSQSVIDVKDSSSPKFSQSPPLSSPLTSSQNNTDMHNEPNRGLEMDADRQRRRHSLEVRDQGQKEMTEIQHSIELYNGMEMKNGIQKFGQIEDCIQDDSHPAVCTRQSPSPTMSQQISSGSTYSNPRDIFDFQDSPAHLKHPFLSVPSIVIEETNDSSKSTFSVYESINTGLSQGSIIKDTGSGQMSPSRGLKRRILEAKEEMERQGESFDNDEERVGQDLRTNVRILKDDNHHAVVFQDTVRASFSSNQEFVNNPLPRTGNAAALSPPSSSTTSSSPPSPSLHPKHWKKRKILDEQRQQEDEEKKLRAQRHMRDEVATKEEGTFASSHVHFLFNYDPSLEDKAAACSSRNLSPVMTQPFHNDDENLIHILPVQQQRSSLPSPHQAPLTKATPPPFLLRPGQLSESKAKPTYFTAPSSPVSMSRLNISPLVSPDSPQYPPPPLLSNPVSSTTHPSPNYSHHSHLLPPPPHLHPFLSSSIPYSYPELQHSKLDTPSLSPLSSLCPATSTAMLFPKSQKLCRDLYFPRLSTLMEASLSSSSLDSLTIPHHHHQLYPLHHPFTPTLLPPHHGLHLSTSLIYPVGIPLSLASGTLL